MNFNPEEYYNTQSKEPADRDEDAEYEEHYELSKKTDTGAEDS